jgi:hypothetical protein
MKSFQLHLPESSNYLGGFLVFLVTIIVAILLTSCTGGLLLPLGIIFVIIGLIVFLCSGLSK